MLTLDELRDELAEYQPGTTATARKAYLCTVCKTVRKIQIQHVVGRRGLEEVMSSENRAVPAEDIAVSDSSPTLYVIVCEHCETGFVTLIYKYCNKARIAVFADNVSASPNLPKAVAFYFIQAIKAHDAGTKAAAIAMYRATLEQILDEQGFKNGMLNEKITALESAIAAKTAPRWAQNISPDALHVLRELGNQAVHPEDFEKLRDFDPKLLSAIRFAILHVLQIAYDQPAESAKHSHRLSEIKKRIGK